LEWFGAGSARNRQGRRSLDDANRADQQRPAGQTGSFGLHRAIHQCLLQKHDLTNSAYSPPSRLRPMENASRAFSLAMEYVEAFWNHDVPGLLSIAKQLVSLRPESVQARLLLAWSAYNTPATDATRQDLVLLAESNFKEALRLAPGSACAHAGYGNFLMIQGRNQEALAEIQAALAIEPGTNWQSSIVSASSPKRNRQMLWPSARNSPKSTPTMPTTGFGSVMC